MRVLVDYRPALRERTGVGQYMHQLARAYARYRAGARDEVTLFTSSWKDRPAANTSTLLGVRVADRRVPVRVLNYLWHRLELPTIETLGISADVVHAAHPLLIPSRRAARVVTIHDLFFLKDPAATHAEIRRDYAKLARQHARRADAIVTNSHYTAAEIRDAFEVPADRIFVCSPGPPDGVAPRTQTGPPRGGHILFVGTLEPRKNVGVLLDAYCALRERNPRTPPLVLAGKAGAAAADWLDRISSAPLAGHVRHLGYVSDTDLKELYAGARLLVMPSRDEGFGIPVLEAMAMGVPVVVANRGALPEVAGDAGVIVDADDDEALACAIERLVSDDDAALACARRGLARAAQFSWDQAARVLHNAYRTALASRAAR